MRKYVIFCVAIFTLLGSSTALYGALAEHDRMLRGYVDATQTTELPYRVPRLGVNADLTQYDEEALNEQLMLMEAAGITWVRQFARWDDIEEKQGQFEWNTFDRIFAAFKDHPSLQPVIVFFGSPSWARSVDSPTAPPDDERAFGEFITAFAERYGDVVDYYQIWDEPNLRAAWGGQLPQAAQYVALLQTAYEALHSADAKVTVISAALAPTTELGPRNISDVRYLEDIYRLGGGAYMDAVAAKPYGFNSSPEDRTVDETVLNFSRIILLREIMEFYGDGKKALWASAWGWNSLPDTWQGDASIWGEVTAEAQIDYTLAALARAEREWPWLGGMILTAWQPNRIDPTSAEWGFALIDRQGTPKPLYTALAQREQAQAATDGLWHPMTPYAEYWGVWKFSPLGADIGWVNDSQAAFKFIGQDIALVVREDNYVAHLYVTIDGEQANATPHDIDGRAYVLLTSDSLRPEMNVVAVARNLRYGVHELRLVANDLTPEELQDRWALVGFAVSSGDRARPYQQQIIIAALTVLSALAATIISGWRLSWKRVGQNFKRVWQPLGQTGQMILSGVTSFALMLGMWLTWNAGTPDILRREPIQLGLAIITGGLVYLELHTVITLGALIGLFIIVYNRLELGLMLAIFFAPFFLFPVELYQFAFPMMELVILITSAAWGLRWLVERASKKQGLVLEDAQLGGFGHWQALDWALIAWLSAGAISLLWADIRSTALTELRTVFVEPALFYFIWRTLKPKRERPVLLVDTLIVAGTVVAILGFVMFLRGEQVITAEGGARRLASVYGSPNNLSLFLGRCIPFALAMVLIPTDRWRRIFAFVALLIMGMAIVLTLSAGSFILGLPISVAAVLWLIWRRKAVWPLAGMGAMGAGAIVILVQVSPRFANLLDFSQGTNFYRLRAWASTWNMLKDNPITGLGLDQFLYAFRGRYIMPDAWQEPTLSHPHNIVLDFWVRLGVVGLVLLIWLQWAFWKAIWSAYKTYRQSNPLYMALAVGAMGSMVNLLAHGLVDNSVYVMDLALVFILLLGLASRLSNMHSIDLK